MGRPGGKGLVGRVSLGKRIRTVNANKGVDPPIDPFNPVQARLHDLASGNFAPLQ